MLLPPGERARGNVIQTGALSLGTNRGSLGLAQVEAMPAMPRGCQRCPVLKKQSLSTATRSPLLSDGTTGTGAGGGPALTHEAHRMSAAWPAAKQTRSLGRASLLARMNIWDWKQKPQILPESKAAPFLGNEQGGLGVDHPSCPCRNQPPSCQKKILWICQ